MHELSPFPDLGISTSYRSDITHPRMIFFPSQHPIHTLSRRGDIFLVIFMIII
jgi:hypothetical protein